MAKQGCRLIQFPNSLIGKSPIGALFKKKNSFFERKTRVKAIIHLEEHSLGWTSASPGTELENK